MHVKMIRGALALALMLAAGGVGYGMQNSPSSAAGTKPADGTIRVVYSLDAKENDQELLALIDAAEQTIDFAVYEFTLSSVTDALVRAKERGVVVRGLVDKGESSNAYNKPIMAKLRAAGIPVYTEQHASGSGIMHIKTLVTEKAYASGSYNWTNSATNINDEVLEIGTDEGVRKQYENILERLFTQYGDNAAAAPAAAGRIPYTDAPKYVGSYATVYGTLVRVHTTSTGTVFLDFCESYKTCPFTGVIFASDAKEFTNFTNVVGASVELSGTIALYHGRAEIILSNPSDLKIDP